VHADGAIIRFNPYRAWTCKRLIVLVIRELP